MAEKLTQKNLELYNKSCENYLQQIPFHYKVCGRNFYVNVPGSKSLITLYHVIGKSIENSRYKTVSKLFIIL